MSQQQWQRSQVLAWTEADGPGRPPVGPSRNGSFALAGALGAVFAGMMTVDTLCPEHRAWVRGIATVAAVTIVLAVVGLLRGWTAAPFLTVVAALGGVAIGAIDTAHDPSRGRLLVIAFALTALGAALLAFAQLGLARFDRQVREQMAPLDDADTGATAVERASAVPTADAGPGAPTTEAPVTH